MIDSQNSQNQLEQNDCAWPPTFAAAAVGGSVVAGCMMPFVAIATIAAGTLDMRRGLITSVACWMANQIIGFGLMGYPVDAATIGSGFALCASMLIAFALARRFGRPGIAGWAVTGLMGFMAYEISLYAMAHLFGGTDMFTAEIIMLIGTNELIWFVGLLAAPFLLARALPGQFGAPLPARTA